MDNNIIKIDEENLIEMYLAGVSVRRIEDVTEILWGSRVSASTVSNLNQKVYGKTEEWRNRPLTGKSLAQPKAQARARSAGEVFCRVCVNEVSKAFDCLLPTRTWAS